MCSRYTIRANAAQLAAQFHALPNASLPFKEGDILPTNNAPCVRLVNGQRELAGLRWWLVPAKSQGIQSEYTMFNARVETVAEKQSFREPFKHRRCLLLTTGWIEGKVIGGTEKKPIKQKHVIARRDAAPFALAGLWDRWEGGGKVVESCTMLMTESTPELVSIHSRMPIVLSPNVFDAWLDPELTGKDAIMSLLTPQLDDITYAPLDAAS